MEPQRSRRGHKRRASNRREANENEKVVIGIVLGTAILGCLVFTSTLDIRSRKTLAGAIIICFALPTISFFALYDPFWKFVRGRRK